jgi:hypothetical protein
MHPAPPLLPIETEPPENRTEEHCNGTNLQATHPHIDDRHHLSGVGSEYIPNLPNVSNVIHPADRDAVTDKRERPFPEQNGWTKFAK